MSSSSSLKGKGKAVATIRPLPNPSSGSANPAASLSSLWAFLLPALDHILKSPTNDASKAPAVDVEFYSRVHSACYNYITSSASKQSEPSGKDLYNQLDRYFAGAAHYLTLGIPDDDHALIQYIVPSFRRFTAGVQSINRLLNYVNRHYVKRAVEEDRGWLTMEDVLTNIESITNETRKQIASKLREQKQEELRKWGYTEGGSPEQLTQAEACAEAASPLDRIVPISSLAYRRFRLSIIEPLLLIPKTGGKRHKKKATRAPVPKGRLARATKFLLESEDIEESEKLDLARGLSELLMRVGIRQDHALRKALDKYIARSSDDPVQNRPESAGSDNTEPSDN